MLRIGSLLAALLCALPATAHANGRFPQSVNVNIQPGDDQVILLAATFGPLISRDGGATFRWVCEEAVGYGGLYDPDYEIAGDGSFYATTWSGLRVSRDGGCTWETIADLEAHWVDEVEIGPDGEVWAATASSTLPNDVFLSTDNGRTFAPRNNQRDAIFWKSLRVAPGDGQRVYLSGYEVQPQTDDDPGGPVPFLYRTDDQGLDWIQLPLDDVTAGPQAWFFLLAVAPDNPDVVFARSVGANPPGGDLLYRSTDAGQTWTPVLTTQNPIYALVIRQNGDIIAGTETEGMYMSKEGGAADTWTHYEVPFLRCLAENGAGELLGCGGNWEPDFFALGRSTDGLAWTSVFRFSDMRAALSCAEDTVQFKECEAKQWPATCERFGCNRADAGPQPDAGMGTAPGGGGCCDVSPRPGWSHLIPAALVLLWLGAPGLRRRCGPARP